MLARVRDLAFRVGEFAIPRVGDADIESALSCLRFHYGSDSDPAVLIPRRDEAEIRAELAKIAPSLARLGSDLFHELQTHYSGVVIRRAWLDHLEIPVRGFVLFALALAMGTPTPTDKIQKRIVWDVKPRELPPGYVSTFSENDQEAHLHTDTQYFPRPERFTLLYFARPAACGGGVSMLRDVGCIQDQLRSTKEGSAALALLSCQELPFRIPTTYTTTGLQGTVEATFATIFADHPRVRYRTDTLEAGLKAFPEYDTAEVRAALRVLREVLCDDSKMLTEQLPADSLLITNNHVGLHGRTGFTDRQRHVLRIRIADGSEHTVKARVVLQGEAEKAA